MIPARKLTSFINHFLIANWSPLTLDNVDRALDVVATMFAEDPAGTATWLNAMPDPASTSLPDHSLVPPSNRVHKDN